MQNQPIRVGKFTLGVTLAGVGIALLSHNLGWTWSGFELWRLWPLLPLLLGIEYLIRELILERQQGEPRRLKLDAASLFLASFILIAGMIYTAMPTSWGGIQSMVGLWRPYEYRAEVSQELADLKGVRSLIVSHQQGDVSVEGTDDDRISVIATVHTWGSSPEAAEQLAQQVGVNLTAGPDVRVELKQPNLQTGASRWSVNYTVRVPKTLPVQAEVALGSLHADGVTATKLTCRNGLLEAANLIGPAELISRMGTVDLRGASDSVIIDAGSGNVSAQNIRGKLRVSNTNGQITITDAAGPVEVRANQGEIRVSNSQPPAGDWLLTTRFGLVDVQLPAGSSVSLTAMARFGDIIAPGWVQVARSPDQSSASGTIGQGQYKLRLQSDRGQIHVLTD